MALARRQVLALTGVGALAAVAGGIIGAAGLRSTGAASALLSYSFQQLDGSAIRLRDWRQPVILCNFWATWCAPCREEVPLLIAARQQFYPLGIEVVGIGIDRVDNLRQFAKELGINYPVLLAPGNVGQLLHTLGDGEAALPFSVLLDSDRRIAYRRLGSWSKSDLQREIRAAIG